MAPDLTEGLSLLRIPNPGAAAERLERFLAELERWNRRFGFVKADRDELIIKHVFDSLAAWTFVGQAPHKSVLDVGSGAGFPGIPLAVALPDMEFTLLERSSKRAAFLSNCKIVLGLPNLRVDAADLLHAGPASCDVVTFRAFAPLGRFMTDLAKSGLAWGTIVAYKGRAARIKAEIEDVRSAGYPDIDVHRVEVPFLKEERHIVVVRSTRRPGSCPGA